MQHEFVPPSAQSWLRLTERNLLGWSLLAALGLLIVLAAPPLAGRIYVRDDLGAFHLPVRAFYAEQLALGEPFDWMPQLYCGFYLSGEGQAGTYHPLHLLWYRFLPLPAALGCEYLASYPLMLVGMWLFLRRRLGSTAAAMLGSLTFTFSTFSLLHFIHPNAVMVVAHVPWLLWAIDVVLRPKKGTGAFCAKHPKGRSGKRCLSPFSGARVTLAQAGIALLTGSQLLLGYPQYVWFSLVAEAAYTVFVLIDRRRSPRDSGDVAGVCHCLPPGKQCVHRASDTASVEAVAHQFGALTSAGRFGYADNSWAKIAIGKGIGLLLGGVQLLPTLDALRHSARWSADAAFAGWGSLHPLNLVQLVAPYLFAPRVYGQNTHELGLYVGAVPLVLAVWALARRRELGALAPLAWAAAGFGVLAMVLAMGDYGPLYHLQTCLPLVGHFRFPCRYIVLFQLAVAVDRKSVV